MCLQDVLRGRWGTAVPDVLCLMLQVRILSLWMCLGTVVRADYCMSWS